MCCVLMGVGLLEFEFNVDIYYEGCFFGCVDLVYVSWWVIVEYYGMLYGVFWVVDVEWIVVFCVVGWMVIDVIVFFFCCFDDLIVCVCWVF